MVKYLPNKYENMGLDPKIYVKSWTQCYMLVTSTLRRGRPEAVWPASELQVHQETLTEKKEKSVMLGMEVYTFSPELAGGV